MDNVLAKINAVKEKIIFGGIILFVVYILIGIIACIADSGNSSSYSGVYATFSRFLSTGLTLGICLFCMLDNLNKIGNKNQVCRIFAALSLVAVPIFLILYFLGAWEAIKFTECTGQSYSYFGYDYCSQETLNFVGKITIVFGAAVALGTVGSLTMSIKSFNRMVIDVTKIIATIALTIAVLISVYLSIAVSSILSVISDSASLSFTSVFCYITWVSLAILAFYLSKFDNGVAPTPLRPLNAKVMSASAPAVISMEEIVEPTKETIYPEPTANRPVNHVDGVNLNATPEPAPSPAPEPTPEPEKAPAPEPQPLHANPGEPLFEEHPTIGPAVTGTTHDEFDTLDNNENKEVI